MRKYNIKVVNKGWFKKKEKIKRTCVVCGKKFLVRPSMEKAKCCSRKCFVKYQKTHPNNGWIKKGSIPWIKGKKGIRNSPKTEFKKGQNTKEKNINWKGGITPLVGQIRHCFQYRQWRSDVFTRDGFTCILCGDDRGGNLVADHYPKMFSEIIREYNIKTIEEAENCELFWNINNGRTLCEECHRVIHKKNGK